MRIVGVILVVIALILGLVLALAALLLPDTASNDAVTRAVEQSTVFGLAPQDVQLDLALSQSAQCQQGARPLDVVVLLDQSGSMDGEPLAQAVAGARAFIETLDLSKHQVALALFSDQVNTYQGLTADRTVLDAALSQAAAGSTTDIASALAAARNELQGTRRRFGSAGFIVLFTDGGAEQATIPQVESLAKSAQDAGIKLFVIGLQGDDYNEPLLQAIASGPDYLRLAPPVAEIPAAFRSIAEEINQVVATDLRVVESVAPGLTVDPATVQPPAAVTAEQVVWQAPALNQQALTEWATLRYQVTPAGYGFKQLAPQDARLSFNDCNNQVVSATLPSGPRVLFLPPVPLTLLPLLLLLIPGLLLIALGGRQPKPGPVPTRSVPVVPAPPAEPATPAPAPSATEGILFMDWLGKVESLSPETGRTPDAPVRNLPTLIVGLGASGRVVLHKIAADLQDRWGPTLPERVRLLQVNVPLGNPAPTDILPNLLEVNLARSGEQLNKSGAHLEWARDVSTRTGRPAGRMALFADLAIGKSESQLHPALRKVLSGQRQTTVWIVADAFSDDSSSIVADLAHLVRTLALPEEISSVRLCLAMHNARWSDRLGPQQRSARAFATLRELQRLRQKRDAAFAYAPGYGQRELEATSAGRIFDEVYLFDGKGEQMNETSYDVSALPAGEGVLEVIAAGLTAFLDPALSQRFLELEKNAQSEVARTGSARLENYVSAMGCCTASVPVEDIRRLAELRLAHRALFDVEDGLFGWERLERNGDLAQRKQVRIDVSARDLAAFKQATGLGGGANPSPAGQTRAKVRAYLDQVMNDGEPLRLRWASTLLEQVTASQPDLSAILDPFQRELGEWIKLVGQVSPPAAAPQQQPASDIDFGFDFSFDLDLPSFDQDGDSGPAGALYQQWERHWQQAREGFPVFKAQSPHTSVATLADEAAIFERYLPRPGQEAARLRRRAYWLWQERQGYMTLQLLVLPNDLTARPANERFRTWGDVLRDNPYAYASSPRDVDAILDGLLAAARAQSRGINAESITLYLGRQSGSLTQTLQRNSSPLFRRKEIGGQSEGVAATPYRYLLAPAADAGDQLATNLKSMRFVGSDPATVVMMQVKHILPIANTVAYDEALNTYRPTRNDQVFLAEQIAAEMENAARQEVLDEGATLLLPPDVVALLEQSQEAVELVGEAMVYGLLEIHPARGAVTTTVTANNDEAQSLAALGVGRLLLEGAPLLHSDGQWRQRLRAAVDEQRNTFAERRYELLNQVRQQALPPLLALPPGAGQELGIVLAAAIQRESVRA
ncbi:MAG: VWA domain-containing protein [Anaerolineae bacterium]